MSTLKSLLESLESYKEPTNIDKNFVKLKKWLTELEYSDIKFTTDTSLIFTVDKKEFEVYFDSKSNKYIIQIDNGDDSEESQFKSMSKTAIKDFVENA